MVYKYVDLSMDFSIYIEVGGSSVCLVFSIRVGDK